jgi:hypothetical protein
VFFHKKLLSHLVHPNTFTILEPGFSKALQATFNQQTKPKAAAQPSQSQQTN